VTPLLRALPEADAPLKRVKALFEARLAEDGHLTTASPDLCFYRFSQPSTFRKAATFGLTLGVVLQGTKRVRLEEHEVDVDQARLLVITRDAEHESAAIQATRDRPYQGLSICFSPERVAHALLALTEAGGPAPSETVPAFVMPCDAPIAEALERLLTTLDDPLDCKLLAPLWTDEILFRLLRSDAAAAVRGSVGRAVDANRILESMRFIREHHIEKLTIEGLARRAAMSPSHYAHRFRDIARTSPMRYLREVRLERARALLLEGETRAGEVALLVGFESAPHFTREFKRRFGVPPSHFRRAGSTTPA
jgi:AraC-like DNA-binding protein